MIKMICLSLGNTLILKGLILGFALLTGFGHADAKPASEPNQGEITKLERKLLSEREKLRKLGFQEKDLLAELTALERDVTEKKRAVRELSRKIHHADAEIESLRRNLLELKQVSTEAQNKVSKKLVEFYKHARIGYVKALTDATDITDLLRRVKYFNIVMAQDRTALVRTAEQTQARQTEISKMETRMNEIQDISRKEEARLMSLKKELEKRVLLLVNIHQEKKYYETAVAELETAAEGLKQTLIDVEKKDNYETNLTGRFEDFRGKLPYPMKGKVMKEQALPAASATPGKYKGILIEGPADSEVMTVFPGRVAFSGNLKGYGELVIINHGSRFFTVSALLSARNKIEGDVVHEGEVIGRIGGDDVSRVGSLYFEIRKAGKSLKPQEWLKTKTH